MSNTVSPTIESFNPDLNAVLTEREEGHYLFIVADQRKTFLILFNKGEVEDMRDSVNEPVEQMIKSDSGEMHGRNDKLGRHIEKQIHVQTVMTEVTRFINGKQINGVFIGGHQPFHHTIQHALPPALQEKFRSAFVTELTISHAALIEHCKQVLTTYSS
jgi:hypothetical protein